MKIALLSVCACLLGFAAPVFASQGAASKDCERQYPRMRAEFRKLFDAKDYVAAFDRLDAYLGGCDWVSTSQRYWIWSDLTLTAYRMKDRPRCEEVGKAVDEFAANYGPEKYGSDAKIRVEMTPPRGAVRAIENNRRLCGTLPAH